MVRPSAPPRIATSASFTTAPVDEPSRMVTRALLPDVLPSPDNRAVTNSVPVPPPGEVKPHDEASTASRRECLMSASLRPTRAGWPNFHQCSQEPAGHGRLGALACPPRSPE